MIKECKACGYKQGESWSVSNEGEGILNEIGDEEFIEILGSFHKSPNYYGEAKVHLYACPKCKTVILEE